jgi:type II secretory pathway pseudopilin PulG
MRNARQSRRSGQTLLELVAATTIIAIALVPALKVMRDSIRVGRETEIANLLATYSSSKLEEHLVRTAASWDTTTDADLIPGYESQLLRYSVTKVDETGLMRLTSRAWEDSNDNTIWDAGEMQVNFSTKVARNVAYQQEASGT